MIFNKKYPEKDVPGPFLCNKEFIPALPSQCRWRGVPRQVPAPPLIPLCSLTSDPLWGSSLTDSLFLGSRLNLCPLEPQELQDVLQKLFPAAAGIVYHPRVRRVGFIIYNI